METQFVFGRISRRANRRTWLVTSVLSGVLSLMLLMFAVVAAHAKTPGSTYCFYSKCHRVNTIPETNALVGETIALHASHYSACHRDPYNPCGLTSSGEKFYPGRSDNAASPIYPDGTILLVWNEATGGSAVVRINNAGPYWGKRKLDVSYEAAVKLGFKSRGVAKLQTMIISAPTREQSRYRKHRTYTRVPGFVGNFESLEEAHRASIAIMAVEAMAGSTVGMAAGGVVSASRFEGRETAKQRTRVAKSERELRLAMNGAQTVWPDFAVAVARSDSDVRPVQSAVITASRGLESPSVQRVALSEPAVSDRNLVRVSTGRVRTASLDVSVENGEWLPPARAAVELVRATDQRPLNVEQWLERGRLGFLFKLSKLETGRVIKTSRVLGQRVGIRTAANFDVQLEDYGPAPVRRRRIARRAAEFVGRVG